MKLFDDNFEFCNELFYEYWEIISIHDKENLRESIHKNIILSELNIEQL